MGIYIPGIEMPIAGMSIEIAENVDGKVYARLGYGLDDWHEVISVPAHGRVVDADAFSAEMRERQEAARKWKEEAKDSETAARADAVLGFLSEVKLTLDKLPTVIPEEE